MVSELEAAAEASQLTQEQLKATMEVARNKEGMKGADPGAQMLTRGGLLLGVGVVGFWPSRLGLRPEFAASNVLHVKRGLERSGSGAWQMAL